MKLSATISAMARDGSRRPPVLLDALGTLVGLEDPFGGLVEELAARGAPVGRDEARRALRAEMAYYRAHHDEASDPAGLADLRDRCAEVLRAELPTPARELPHDVLLAALLDALRFRAFPEVPGALAALREAGHPLVVVSNWDVSLHAVLDRTGLAGAVDGVVTSAELGAAKPDPAIFAHALGLVGAPAAGALHVGDSVEADVHGALAAGLRPVLVARDGMSPEGVPAGVPVVRELGELAALAAYPGIE
jgi:putative hydrolase of the HAD superfamily